MLFKIIRNELVICKPSSIMGNYSFIKYCNMDNTDTTNHYLLSNGVTIRGNNINGKKDKFGDEYVYNTTECIEKKLKNLIDSEIYLIDIKIRIQKQDIQMK